MDGPNITHWVYCFDADCVVSGLYNWQTLVGVLVAIGAAWYAGMVVRSQIKAAADQENDRYTRRLNAARSLLPLTLSGMSDYAHDVAATLMCVISGLSLLEPYGKTPNITTPDVPHDLIDRISNMIEATVDQNVIRMLRKMVGEVQVLNSRVSGLEIELAMEPEAPHNAMLRNIDVYLLQCGVIYAQCSAMFEFARFEQDSVPDHLPWDEVFTAFSAMGIREYEYENLFAFCVRARTAGRSAES